MASTSAQWILAMNITGSPIVGETGAFETDDICYRRSDFEGANIDLKYKPFKILKMIFKTDAAGNILDANGIAADPTTPAADTSTTEGASDTGANFPFFYKIIGISNTGVQEGKSQELHEKDIVFLVGANVLRDAIDWTDPA